MSSVDRFCVINVAVGTDWVDIELPVYGVKRMTIQERPAEQGMHYRTSSSATAYWTIKPGAVFTRNRYAPDSRHGGQLKTAGTSPTTAEICCEY